MSSYAGVNTAEEQAMKRRAQKQKQRLGTKKGFSSREQKVDSIRLPRVVNAVFSGSTQEAIDQRRIDKPEFPITSQFFKRLLKRGIEFKVNDDNFATMDGEVFVVDEEGIHTPIFVHTVRFWVGMGYGFEVKQLRNGRVVVD